MNRKNNPVNLRENSLDIFHKKILTNIYKWLLEYEYPRL